MKNRLFRNKKTVNIHHPDYFIIGNFGYVTDSINGQTVKTRNLYDFFSKRFHTNFYDTELLKFKPFSIFHIFFSINNYSKLIITLNKNGLRYLVPIIYLLAKMLRCNKYFFVIGGWISDFIKKHPIANYCLKHFDGVFVESKSILANLENIYFSNVSYLFNFKTFNYVNNNIITKTNRKSSLKIIFLSRVTWDKGLDIIKNIAKIIDEKKYSILIDIYGPIQLTDQDDILKMIGSFKCLKYNGLVHPDRVYEIMSNYDVLLFPTHYPGEGFPGVLLDAFISGISIIASNWKCNSEIVTPDVGFLFELDKVENILDYCQMLYYDNDYLNRLKMNAYARREEYSINKVEEILREKNVI
jgi:glycosyltransferase involved in cell wall biosynthesis